MRSQCIVTLPYATAYAWKLPATPQINSLSVDHLQHPLYQTASQLPKDAPKTECPFIPWKAYLASREVKNLASNLANAVFSPSSTGLCIPDIERPFSLNARQEVWGIARSTSGSLLTSILPDTEDLPLNTDPQMRELALAA